MLNILPILPIFILCFFIYILRPRSFIGEISKIDWVKWVNRINQADKSEYKKNLNFFCETLNIDENFQKRLNKEFGHILSNSFFTKECDSTFEATIMRCYLIMVIDDIRLYQYDYFISKSKCFDDYVNNHKMDIKKLKILLRDYQYKNNHFLFQNIIHLGQVLKEPFMKIDNIYKSNISEAEKIKEINYIKTEIFETYDKFFNIVNELYTEYTSTLNKTKNIFKNTKMSNSLDLYKSSLTNIVEDINKKQVKLN